MSWQFLVTVITLPCCDPIGGAVDDTRNMTPTVPAEVTTMTHVPAPLLASCLKHLLELELNSIYDVISIHSHVKIFIYHQGLTLDLRKSCKLIANCSNGFKCLSITGSFEMVTISLYFSEDFKLKKCTKILFQSNEKWVNNFTIAHYGAAVFLNRAKLNLRSGI